MENLDDIDKDELYTRFCRPSAATIARIENMDLATAHLYKKYAQHKHLAIRVRLVGNINRATQEEAICEQIYGRIRQSERW